MKIGAGVCQGREFTNRQINHALGLWPSKPTGAPEEEAVASVRGDGGEDGMGMM